MAHLRRVVEVCLEPKWRATAANLREVRTLTSIADQGRAFTPEVFDTPSRSPHQVIGRVGAHILGMAVDASFGNVNLASSFGGRQLWGVGVSRADGALYAEGSGQHDSYDKELAFALTQHSEQRRQQYESRRHMAEVLAHADAHRRSKPARDGVDPSGLPAALSGG